MVDFHQWLSSSIFYRSMSSSKGSLPPEAVFHQRVSSVKTNSSSKDFSGIHQLLSSINCCLPLKDRHGKSRNHASTACGQFLRKLWTFWDKQRILGIFFSSMAISLHNSCTIIVFQLRQIQCIEKNGYLGRFYMLRNYVILRTFFNPENWLADKNQLFTRLLKDVFFYQSLYLNKCRLPQKVVFQ